MRFDGLQGYEIGRRGRWGETVGLQADESERIVGFYQDFFVENRLKIGVFCAFLALG